MSTQTALIPDRDPAPPVPDLGALEPKKKKHKPGTLRRALTWLRGRKKKKSEVKQPEGKDNSKPDGEPQPAPPQEDDSPDNVFFPSGRNSVVEEIHSQAQEGLKSLQRREKQQSKHSFQDENKTPESTTDTNDNEFRTRSHSYTTENTDEAIFTRSEMIKRKGSTFRPHDSPRSPSNRIGRKRKEKRATVVGVPQHIAAELGLHPSSTHRGIHDMFFRREDGQLVEKKSAEIPVANGVQSQEAEFVVIPTVDGKPASVPHDGAHVCLAVLEQTEKTLQRHIDKVYHDDSCIGWKSASKLSPMVLRPKSLAVPGMTTHSPQSDSVGPVMSISPQGTYMSKIIPNAVLPPLVDVVALSRSSVRTLSRCSLASASPASVRGSLHRGRGMSCSSDNWSRSQSTETIVSDSSTISSRGGDNTVEANEKSGLSTGRTSPAPSTGTQDGSDAASLCSGRSSVRSVSLRKSKKAPPPPTRTYSLQQHKELGLPPRPDKKPSAKTNHGKDPWVLRTEKVSSDNDVFLPSLAGPKENSPSRSERTMSPSSGYSSQSGTPTMPVKSLLESPGSCRKTPPKPERSSLKSASLSMSSPSSVENNFSVPVSPPRAGSSMGDQVDQIPPHPSVPAPFCPPPTSSVALMVAVTPSPSPPPAHHPTPPPTRKSESDAGTAPLVKEDTAQKESLWPPPPPETSDIQDLSMADFPPPDEELFLPPPPSVEPVDKLASAEPVSVANNDKSTVLIAEKPMSTSNNEESLHVVATLQPESVPLNSAKPLDTAEHALVTENNTHPVPPLVTENIDCTVPPSTEPTAVPVSSDISLTNGEASTTYKPQINTTSTISSEPKETPDVIVPQDSVGNLSLTTKELKNTTKSSVTTVSSTTVESTVPNVPSSVAVTSSVHSKAVISPLSKSSTWKPVTAPGSVKKEPATSQSIVVAQKDDANLPIVTPSLLQMVRLRSIQARVPQSPFSPPSGLPAPQKPVRKSLSQRSSHGSESSPTESPTAPPVSPMKPPESPTRRSPASAASFVFARSSKKFVFDPPTSQDAESSLKKDIVAELKAQGGPRSPDEKPPLQRKPSKIPPPVARKPSVGVPRTPTTPSHSTVSTNGSVFSPTDPGLAPSTSAAIASGTPAGHEQQQKSQTEQA